MGARGGLGGGQTALDIERAINLRSQWGRGRYWHFKVCEKGGVVDINAHPFDRIPEFDTAVALGRAAIRRVART